MAKQQRKKVEQREDGVFYLTGTDTPYSGKWYEVDSGAYGDATIKNGKLDGTFTWYRPDGSKAGEGTFRDGELVQGSEKWWNSVGDPVDSQAAARQPPAEQPQQPGAGAPSVSGELTDQQVADILEPLVGEFEGTAVARGPDGMVQEEFSITSTVRWVEEGKSLEMLSSEHHQQGKLELIFTKSYDREKQRFVLTRRMASDPEPEIFKPGAYETYDAKTRTFHGVVVEGLPPDSTFTWTMQLIDDDRSIYTSEFRSSGKVQSTLTDNRQRVTGQQVPDAKNDLSAALSGNRLYLAINGENFWVEFHADGSCYRGQGVKPSPTKAQWTVRGNRVKVVEGSDDDYLVFADLTARPDSEVIFLNSADRAESEGTKGIVVRVGPIPPASDAPDPREMVQGVANALAANDYEAFTKFTCLGMKKDEFKQFMDDNGDGKVIRVWDRAKDDFQAELKTNMHEAFQEILEEAQEEGFDWSQAKVIKCEFTDDVKAKLVSGSAELILHLDDCFVTPQGLLMFDAPRGRFAIP